VYVCVYLSGAGGVRTTGGFSQKCMHSMSLYPTCYVLLRLQNVYQCKYITCYVLLRLQNVYQCKCITC
jgi:hypothetical protein